MTPRHLALATVAGLLLTTAGDVRAADLRPFHVYAQTNAVEGTGYRARIQVRDAGQTPAAFTWIGGYLADWTFVQVGLVEPSQVFEGRPMAFVWHDDGRMPLWFELPGTKNGDWIGVEATWDRGTWTYSMNVAGVSTTLLVASGPRLGVMQAAAEFWLEKWGPFPSQAMRSVKLRTGTTWADPALAFSPVGETCGTSMIRATRGLNLSFFPAAGATCYVTLRSAA